MLRPTGGLLLLRRALVAEDIGEFWESFEKRLGSWATRTGTCDHEVANRAYSSPMQHIHASERGKRKSATKKNIQGDFKFQEKIEPDSFELKFNCLRRKSKSNNSNEKVRISV